MKTQHTITIVRHAAALTMAAGLALATSPVLAGADFNGDGFDDLAVAAPGETINGKFQAGQVHVIYGSANGLSAVSPLPDQVFHQDTPGVNQTLETNDRFADALAVGDFDADGFDDLAIGSPFEAITSGGVNHPQAGVVNILYGSAQGLTAAGDQDFIQGSEGVNGQVTDFNWFGWSLAAADFDGDGFEDLAIGVPGLDVDGVGMAGGVEIMYGSDAGLTGDRAFLLTQDTQNVLDQPESMDRFGLVLAAADFGNDGFADLAIGVPDESITVNGVNRTYAGIVQVIYGRPVGLAEVTLEGGVFVTNEIWHQDKTDVPGAVQQGDRFGTALAAAHLGSSTLLAIGAPSDKDAQNGSGSVTVLFASIKADRLLAAGAKRIRLQDLGVADPTSEDGFGAAIAAADFGRSFNQNGDGGPVGGIDLAIGASERKVKLANGTTVQGAGSVYVVYRTATGFSAPGVQIIAQGVGGMPGTPKLGEDFGSALAAGNFNGSGRTDLVIGVPFDDQAAFHAGCIHVLNGDTGGLTIGGQMISQNTANIADQCESSDAFGLSLGAR